MSNCERCGRFIVVQDEGVWFCFFCDPSNNTPWGRGREMKVEEKATEHALGEDAPADLEARLKQEQLWAGTRIDARQQLPAREAARVHAGRFQEAVQWYHVVLGLNTMMEGESSYFSRLSPELLSKIVAMALPGQGGLVYALLEREEHLAAQLAAATLASLNFNVFIRKRPLLQIEAKLGEYDVVEMESTRVLCHDGRLDLTGKRLTMRHVQFEFDRVFDEHADNAAVCSATIEPLVQHVLQGNNATAICYGQTGTGKTYTLMAALEHVAMSLESAQVKGVSLQFIEVHGKFCYDLLNHRKVVKLLSDAKEVVHAVGAQSTDLQRPYTLNMRPVLADALRLRSSEVTERNLLSSRSHAICSFHVGPGVLTLVDLAGSERNYETTQMTPAQHRESADINWSLMALKECFRANYYLSRGETHRSHPRFADKVVPRSVATTKVRAPYRTHMLTRILRSCFEEPSHRSVIIATVSPTPTDLEHTLNTLEHVGLTTNASDQKWEITLELPLQDQLAFSGTPVHLWTAEQVRQWLDVAEGGRFAEVVLPPGMDGARVMLLGANRLAALFENMEERAGRQDGHQWTIAANQDTSRSDTIGRALFAALRQEQQHALDTMKRKTEEQHLIFSSADTK